MAYDYLTKQRHKIGAKSTVTINLAYGVNYFRVVNSGAASVYCGLSNMPTKNSYEFKVSGQAARMYAEDKLYKQIYIYNDGAADADIILYSFRAKFDPSVMALGDFAENQNKTVEVEIAGFTNPLPAGSNLIGRVGVESLPDAVQTKLLALPNQNYKTDLANILTAIGNISGGSSVWTEANITNLLSYVDGVEGLLTQISNAFAAGNNTAPTSVVISGSGTYSGKVVKLLTNDGDNDIKITYGSNTFVIKAGESMTDLPLGASAITFAIAPNTDGQVISGRLLYV